MQPDVRQLAQQNRALQQEVANLRAVLQTRARAHMGELADALGYTLAGARAGDLGCRQDLKVLLETLSAIEGSFSRDDTGQRQWSGIVLANGSVQQT